MSMNQESDRFEQLRRLLALKRHEQPPPGYFHAFSRQVIARIESGALAEASGLMRLFGQAPWFRRLWAAFESKPILAGAFGALVCGLVVFGVVYSEKVDITPTALNAEASLLYADSKPARLDNPLVAAGGPAEFLSTTGLATNQAGNSLFGNIQFPSAQPVSWNLPGH